jgi:hypothetical protein
VAAPLWPLREDRTLSAYAKLAYVMLWTRGSDAHPSMKTLAADMACSVRKAQMAVRELDSRGLVKVLPRLTASGDPDSNTYELYPVQDMHHPSAQSAPGVPHTVHPKNGSSSTEVKGDKSRASRLARPAAERPDDQKISVVRRAVDHVGWDNADLDDEDALNIYARFITERQDPSPVGDEVKYLYSAKTGRGIFASFDSIDGVLSNTGERDPWD